MLRTLFLLIFLFFPPTGAGAVEIAGDLTQGGMVTGRVAPGQQVLLQGEPVKVGANGRFVIGFGRDAELEQELAVLEGDSVVERRTLALQDREFDIERIDGLPEEEVTLPPDYIERRKRETAMVGDARAEVSDMLHWADGFRWPAVGRISGVYGSQRILNGKPRWPHYGLDIAAAEGTPVTAPAAGIVRLAESDFLLEGGIVIIDHGFGVSSTLFHLSTVEVEPGARVAAGDRIGSIGSTGRATGAHVDWRINWRDRRLDPRLLVGEMPTREARR